MCAGQHIQNINWVMAFLILCWFVITIIYIVVRATKSLHLGKATAYGVWVLIMEVSLHICFQSHLLSIHIGSPDLRSGCMSWRRACTSGIICIPAHFCSLTFKVALCILRAKQAVLIVRWTCVHEVRSKRQRQLLGYVCSTCRMVFGMLWRVLDNYSNIHKQRSRIACPDM